MSDLFGSVAPGTVALTAAVAKTVVQLQAPTNHRVKITGWGVFFDGISATAVPPRIRILRQSTAGTMSSLTPKQTSPRLEVIQSTALHTATVEPTLVDIIDIITCHPQQGYEIKYPEGQEIILGGGERIGIEVLAAATVNVMPKMFFEE